MPTRLPPSNQPSEMRQTDGPRRSTRAASDDAPRLIKREAEEPKSTEAQLWAGMDMDRSLEIRASDVEARMAESMAAEKADKEEGGQHASDVRDEAEKAAKGKGLFKVFAWQKQQAGTADPKAQLLKNEQTRREAALKGNAPAFTKQGQSSTAASSSRLPMVGAQKLTSASASRLNAVGGVQQALMGNLRNERPPDAYALLKDAREKGVLFVEDALAEGHSEDQEDPELADAVEECIRQCFGVRGILRIGPGHNDKNEAIIVVATTNGFSEASLQSVPQKVHRFPTLVAIPFELLPLKRER